jgi:hypothetical protein
MVAWGMNSHLENARSILENPMKKGGNANPDEMITVLYNAALEIVRYMEDRERERETSGRAMKTKAS